MLEETFVSLPTFATAIVMSVSWAAGLAGVYYGLRSRICAGDSRMDRLAHRLDDGANKFAALEQKLETVDGAHRDHSERIVRLETLFGAMDGKLDVIVGYVSHPKGPK